MEHMFRGGRRGERPETGRDVSPPTPRAPGSRRACPRLSRGQAGCDPPALLGGAWHSKKKIGLCSYPDLCLRPGST